MNPNYSFDPVKLAKEIAKFDSISTKFTSWVEVVRTLARRNFNRFEAEAFLRSDFLRSLVNNLGNVKHAPTSATLRVLIDGNQIKPGCKLINKMVMDRFGEEYDLELNDRGQPCRRGTMPGNYDRNRTVLVPLGTPACCDPTQELYWSM